MGEKRTQTLTHTHTHLLLSVQGSGLRVNLRLQKQKQNDLVRNFKCSGSLSQKFDNLLSEILDRKSKCQSAPSDALSKTEHSRTFELHIMYRILSIQRCYQIITSSQTVYRTVRTALPCTSIHPSIHTYMCVCIHAYTHTHTRNIGVPAERAGSR